jgi:hypothetical protein
MKLVDGDDEFGAERLAISPSLELRVEFVQGQASFCLVDGSGELAEGFLLGLRELRHGFIRSTFNLSG